MNKISVLSLNIVNGNTVLNDNGVPILFYWNKNDDLKSCLVDSSFKSKVLSLCKNDMYTTAKLKCIYFEDENVNIDGNEKYNIIEYDIQDLFPIVDNEIIAYRIIMYILHDLYITIFKHSVNEEYKLDSLDSVKNILHVIYSSILNQNKISPNTIFQYVLCKVSEIKSLNKNNIDSIIKITKQVLTI